MICRCINCGEKYERFNLGGYQEESPHKCKEMKKNGRK